VPHVGTWIEIVLEGVDKLLKNVVPHVGTWIEMSVWGSGKLPGGVVPHVGTWIEMANVGYPCSFALSCLT